MLRKLGFLLVALGLALPVSAADKPGALAGYVRDAHGVPQMGAMVEVLGSAMQSLKVFTDQRGFYTAAGLLPGLYTVKVSAPSFLPTLRERVGIRPGSKTIANVTLSTLFEAIQMIPTRTQSGDEDWKWVLRSAANRPVLRVLDDGTAVVVSAEQNSNSSFKGSVSFFAGSGSEGYGSASDMNTAFAVQKSIFSAGTVGLLGNVGYGSASPTAVLRASYIHHLANGSTPQVAFTMRRLAAPDGNLHSSGLQALALTTSDNFTIGDLLELSAGSELQTIQFMGRVSAFKPFGSVDLHLSPDMVLEYSYATSQPNTRMEKGFDSAPADLSESGPRVTIAAYAPFLEKAHHHELSLSRRFGKTNLQIAAFRDRIANPALTGVGDPEVLNGDILPDVYSGTFTYQGRELDTHGMRVVLQRKLNADLTATLDYGYGGVLDVGRSDVTLQELHQSLVTRDRHSLGAKVSGTMPCLHTRWIASYRWTSGGALTPVDMFNASAGQIDPYFNLFLRQPIPGTGFLPGRMEALLDLRNLLAQGYVPVLGTDGHTVYLVQAARSVRGGVAFTF